MAAKCVSPCQVWHRQTESRGSVRASRLMSILLLLQNRGQLTAPELATELEVSVRTIYRDMDSLSAAGIPVIADRGTGGGFRLLDGYRTRLTGLTADEADSLFLAGTPGVAADLGLEDVLATAQLKMLAALPDGLRDRADRARARFLLDAPGWYHDDTDLPCLPALADAVWNQRAVAVRYQRWGGDEVCRTLEPLGLVLKGGVWYVVAAVDGDRRTYRVSRVRSVKPTGETFVRPADFELAAYWAEWSQAFNRRMYPGAATIRLSPNGMALLTFFLDTYRTQAVRATASPPDADGWVTATLPIETFTHAALELLHFGMEAEVIAPAELRQTVAALAAQIADRHARAFTAVPVQS